MQFCADLFDSDEDSDTVSERVYSSRVDDQLSLTDHSHPLNREDVESLGINIPEQFEEWVDSSLCTPSGDSASVMHYCSSHKATVPIARMREILDIDNCEEFAYYRCSDCSKCVKCRTSTRRHAISLQESVEQELIERSVTNDHVKKKVFVNYPWTKNPVEFLIKKHNGPDNYHQPLKM